MILSRNVICQFASFVRREAVAMVGYLDESLHYTMDLDLFRRIARIRTPVYVARSLAAGIEPEGRGVGYVGVMGMQDRLDVLLDDWAIVKHEDDLVDARLDLVGDGPARPIAERRARELGVADSVRFWGFQPPTRYVPILARCLIGVSRDPPTPFSDLSSMVKILDYMAIGRGCLAFELTETKRLGGDAVRFAPSAGAEGLATALREVLRQPKEALLLGELGRQRIDALRLNWERSGALLVDAYEALLESRPGPVEPGTDNAPLG